MAHFLLTTFGSLGDLHPYIAVGLGLRERGHRVSIATSEGYRAKVEGEGLELPAVATGYLRLAAKSCRNGPGLSPPDGNRICDPAGDAAVS